MLCQVNARDLVVDDVEKPERFNVQQAHSDRAIRSSSALLPRSTWSSTFIAGRFHFD